MAVTDAPRGPRRGAHPILLMVGFIVNMMTIALPIWNVGGAPVRTLVSLAVLLFAMIAYQRAFMRALVLNRRWLFLLGGFALLGIVVSVLNGTEVPVMAREVAAIHIQGAVNLMLSAMLVELCGPAAVTRAFVAAVSATALVAILQFIDLGAAWDLRRAIGNLQGEVFHQYDYLDDKRAMGVSFSPIVLATQLCLGFAAYGVLREYLMRLRGRARRIDLLTLAAAALFAIVCVGSGNRSPLLGIMLFLFFYLARQKRAVFWVIGLPILVAVLVTIGPLLLDSVQQSNLRVAEVGDKSSLGRQTLLYYGTLLFINHPFGYGLDFDPTRYWQQYWSQVQDMPNANTIQAYPLHDYVLNMLNFYGVGMVLLAPWLYQAFRDYRWTVLYFVPYIMHILFHNAGPFWDDPLVWTVFAVAAGFAQTLPNRNSPAARARRSAAPPPGGRQAALAVAAPPADRVVADGRS